MMLLDAQNVIAPAANLPRTGLRVAYQGEPGAFSEEAIIACFGDRAERVPCATFEAVGRAVSEGEADLAMLPVENSTIGSIEGAIAVIDRYALVATAEHTLPVRLGLLALPGTSIEHLTTVRSHPAALAQCAGFLRAHATVHAEPVLDTAGAAREIADTREPRVGAIASLSAALRYGLQVLAADIQDTEDNRTRFLILKRGP